MSTSHSSSAMATVAPASRTPQDSSWERYLQRNRVPSVRDKIESDEVYKMLFRAFPPSPPLQQRAKLRSTKRPGDTAVNVDSKRPLKRIIFVEDLVTQLAESGKALLSGVKLGPNRISELKQAVDPNLTLDAQGPFVISEKDIELFVMRAYLLPVVRVVQMVLLYHQEQLPSSSSKQLWKKVPGILKERPRAEEVDRRKEPECTYGDNPEAQELVRGELLVTDRQHYLAVGSPHTLYASSALPKKRVTPDLMIAAFSEDAKGEYIPVDRIFHMSEIKTIGVWNTENVKGLHASRDIFASLQINHGQVHKVNWVTKVNQVKDPRTAILFQAWQQLLRAHDHGECRSGSVCNGKEVFFTFSDVEKETMYISPTYRSTDGAPILFLWTCWVLSSMGMLSTPTVPSRSDQWWAAWEQKYAAFETPGIVNETLFTHTAQPPTPQTTQPPEPIIHTIPPLRSGLRSQGPVSG